jgi:phage FluMu protein Com
MFWYNQNYSDYNTAIYPNSIYIIPHQTYRILYGETTIMSKRISLLPFIVLFLLIVFFISACSGTSGETTPTQEKFQMPDASPSLESKEEPIASSEPSKTSEPTAEASPLAEESIGVESIAIGKTLLEERCTKCHDLNRVTSKSKTLEEWKTTVDRMVNKGADLDMVEQEILIRYLAETYP